MCTKICFAFAVLALCLATGCGTSITSSGDPEGVEDASFGLRTSPEAVLENIVLSYGEMNATEYLDCLSDDFCFFPSEQDVQDPDTNLPPEWYKSDETTMHQNMFAETSDVENIDLTLTEMNVVHDQGHPSDPTDDVWVHTVAVDLRVNAENDLTYWATTPSEFRIRVDRDQLGPSNETLYEIFRWYDLGDGDRDAATWGLVKALYR